MSEQLHEESKEGLQSGDKLNQVPKSSVCPLTGLGTPSDSPSSEYPISSDDEVSCRKPEGTDTCMKCEPHRVDPQSVVYDV